MTCSLQLNMSSLKVKAQVIELSKGTYFGMLKVQHGQNTREICTPKGTKAEAFMNIFSLPEYQAKQPRIQLV